MISEKVMIIDKEYALVDATARLKEGANKSPNAKKRLCK
jgi:hypothetical protein